jgi:hypothetical protein
MPGTFGAMLIVVRTSISAMRLTKMKEHEFTLVLTADPTDEEADTLYGAFNDGTISTIAGVPQIQFHREAASLEDAIRSAINDVRSAGFDIQRVEMRPDMLPA